MSAAPAARRRPPTGSPAPRDLAARTPLAPLAGRERLVVGAVLLAAWAVLFAPQVFLGHGFIRGDARVYRPFAEFSRARWQALHERTHWNPYVLGGIPASPSLADHRPQYLPDALIDLTEAVRPGRWLPLGAPLLVHLVGMLAMAALARAVTGAGPPGMVFAGIAWGLMPELVVPFAWGHDAKLVTLALLPAGLLAVHHTVTALHARAAAGAALLFALVFAVQILTGHPQFVVYAGLATAVFAIVEAWSHRRPLRLAWLVGAAALAVVTGAGLWLPAMLYGEHSFRGGQGASMDEVRALSLAWRDLLALPWPQAVGGIGMTYWGGLVTTDYPRTVGAITVVLAGVAIARGAARTVRGRLWIGLFVVCAVLSMGARLGPLYDAFITVAPFTSRFRVASGILCLAELALVLLAASAFAPARARGAAHAAGASHAAGAAHAAGTPPAPGAAQAAGAPHAAGASHSAGASNAAGAPHTSGAPHAPGAAAQRRGGSHAPGGRSRGRGAAAGARTSTTGGRWALPAIGVLGALFAAGLATGVLGDVYVTIAQSMRSEIPAEWAARAARLAGADLLLRLALAGAAIALLGWASRDAGRARRAGWALVALVAIDLGSVSVPAVRRSSAPASLMGPRPRPLLAQVAARDSSVRVWSTRRMPATPQVPDADQRLESLSNDWVDWRVRQLGGDHGAPPATWRAYKDVPPSFTSVQAVGVSYVSGPAAATWDSARFEVVARGEDEMVMRVRGALGRAWAVGTVLEGYHDMRTMQMMSAPDFNPATRAYAANPEIVGAYPGSSRTRIVWRRDDADHLALDVTAPDRAFVVIADTWSPGWTATVDGRGVPIHRVNQLVRGVEVPGGAHRLEMRYEPPGWARGFALTRAGLSAGALAMLAWLVWRAWPRRRAATAPA